MMRLFRLLVSLAVVFVAIGAANAQQPESAVCRLPSHGGSAVCIQTGPGYSYLLSCAHCFEGSLRSKPIVIEAPAPTVATTRAVGVRLVKLDPTSDLALLVVNAQLPYVCPVPPSGFQPALCTTAGYDEMKGLTIKRATITRSGANWTITREPPWHGRSGGGLIDSRGYLVGVVHAYEDPVAGPGIHVSHASIVRFLASFKGTQMAPVPQQPPQVYEQRTPYQPQAFPPQQQFQFRQPQIYEQRSQGFALPCPT